MHGGQHIGRADAADDGREEVAGVAQVGGGEVEHDEGSGEAGFEVTVVIAAEEGADVAGDHAQDVDGSGIGRARLAGLGAGHPVGEVEFGEEVGRGEHDVVGAEQGAHPGVEQGGDRGEGETEGGVGAGIDRGGAAGGGHEGDLLGVGLGEMDDEVGVVAGRIEGAGEVAAAGALERERAVAGVFEAVDGAQLSGRAGEVMNLAPGSGREVVHGALREPVGDGQHGVQFGAGGRGQGGGAPVEGGVVEGGGVELIEDDGADPGGLAGGAKQARALGALFAEVEVADGAGAGHVAQGFRHVRLQLRRREFAQFAVFVAVGAEEALFEGEAGGPVGEGAVTDVGVPIGEPGDDHQGGGRELARDGGTEFDRAKSVTAPGKGRTVEGKKVGAVQDDALTQGGHGATLLQKMCRDNPGLTLSRTPKICPGELGSVLANTVAVGATRAERWRGNPVPSLPMKRSLRSSLSCVCWLAALWVAPSLHADFKPEPLQICQGQPALGVPDWVRGETIYEINVRQYSEAGTFAAVEADLPRIRDLGVGVLWFMPVHPIGTTNRKGPLGSYYSIADYRGINPEFGTEADFVRLVKAAQALGMRVVMDWVGNHTAWDHPWTKSHPEYYAHNAAGDFVPPYGFDWTDVIQLDYTNPALWDAAIGDMLYWVETAGIDGYRCDYATGVPTAFWNEAGRRLRAAKPDFYLLSESEVPQHQLAGFNSSYSFGMMHVINTVASGEHSASHIDEELARTDVRFPTGGSLIYYTTNHDENSWQGTINERLGGGVEAFGVLTFLFDGIPLIYNGQEAGLAKRLEFFERDPIAWGPHPLAGFYRTLCDLRRSTPALHTGASFRRLPTTANEAVYAVLRDDGADSQVVAFLNLSDEPVTFDAADPALGGAWQDAFGGAGHQLGRAVSMALPAWGYLVLVKP